MAIYVRYGMGFRRRGSKRVQRRRIARLDVPVWLRVWFSVAVAGAAQFLVVASAYADHRSRNDILTKSGLSYLLTVLVIIAAVLAVAFLAWAVLEWERRDTEHPG